MSGLTEDQLKDLMRAGHSLRDIIGIDRKVELEIERRRYSVLAYNVESSTVKNLRRVLSPDNRHLSTSIGVRYKTFMRHLLTPLQLALDEEIQSRAGRARCCQLELKYRLYRTMCFMRGDRVVTLADLTGQSPGTVLRDIRRIFKLVSNSLARDWIKLPKKGSAEYRHLRGAGDFIMLENIPYAADCSLIPIPKPVKDQAYYYHGGKKKHGLIMFTMASGFGDTYCLIGPVPASISEPELVWGSHFQEKIKPYVLYINSGASRNFVVHTGTWTRMTGFSTTVDWGLAVKTLISVEYLWRQLAPLKSGLSPEKTSSIIVV